MPGWVRVRTRIGRRTVVLPSAVVVLVLPLLFVDWFRILRGIPVSLLWRSELVFLIGIEIGYGLSLIGSTLAAAVLTVVCVAARRKGRRTRRAGRWLLCAVSLLIALMVGEVLVFVRRERASGPADSPEVGQFGAAHPSTAHRLSPRRELSGLREQLPDDAGSGAVDLVVLGESSAEGVPFQKWLSVGALVKWQLEEAIAGMNVRLTIVARSGDTLENQYLALAGLKRRPRILIIYCGHNEFCSRFFAFEDPPYYFRDQRPSVLTRFVEEAEQVSPICGLIRRSADRCRIALPPPLLERDLVDVPVFTREEYSRILLDFRQTLEATVSYASRLGALPVLISPPGNDTDFEPNRSYLPAGTSIKDRESFRQAFREARRLEDVDSDASLREYQALLVREPGFAETHYRVAKLLRKRGEFEESYRHFIEARDRDGYPMRCLSAFQEVYREVASHHDCIFIDGQSYFHAIGRNGLLDDELFQDAMHPSLRGEIALAQAVLHAIAARGAFGWPSDSKARAIDPNACVAHFRLGRETWEHAARWGQGFYSLVGRLRYENAERSRRIDDCGLAARAIQAGAAPYGVGLINVGVPAPVPFISGEGRRIAVNEK